jgi:dicarboxylate transporter 10
MVGNPTEVVLVRMCADGAKLTAQRFGYTNAIQGLMRVWREEGRLARAKHRILFEVCL